MISTCYTINMSPAIAQTLTDFNVVVLAFLHVNSDGSLMYNNDPISPGSNPEMAEGIQALWDSGVIPLLSMGGTNEASDFQNFYSNYQTAYGNLMAIMESYEIFGLDFDLESSYSAQDLCVCTALTNTLAGAGYLVTAVPTGEPTFWQQLVQNTSLPNNGGPSLFWYNLQLYGGVDYGQWVTAFEGYVSNPQAFLGSGYMSVEMTPPQITSQLQTLLQSYPDSAEAFIWRSPLTSGDYTMSDYAAAINNAGPSTSAARTRLEARRDRLAKARKGIATATK